MRVREVDIEFSPSIPILDNPFTAEELDKIINNVNISKCYLGFSPGLIKAVPVNWLLF